ncbi:MAG: hypothetical protein R3E91_05590 [Chlamydiales bacterium]
MRIFFSKLIIFLMCSHSLLHADSNTFLDYQNYNHGYCPSCNCHPCSCVDESCVDEDPQPKSNPACTESSNTFLDYQNYNHGYCPSCNCYPCSCDEHPQPNPCTPPATSTSTQCGLNIVYVGLGIAVIVTAATLIIGSNNGVVHSHTAP